METLRSKVIRLAANHSSLRPHLLPLVREHQQRTAAPKGDLFAENKGERTAWKKGVTQDQAADLVEEWDEMSLQAQDDDDVAEELENHPLKEGGDAIWVAEDGTEYLFTDGEWEEN